MLYAIHSLKVALEGSGDLKHTVLGHHFNLI